MKIGFLGGFPTSALLYKHLVTTKQLSIVCIQEVTILNIVQRSTLISQFKKDNIPFLFLEKDKETQQLEEYLSGNSLDVVFVCGYSKRIPETILSFPKQGFLNIHFGRFPDNRGADPVFWTLKNQQKHTEITIHKMDAEFDTGVILVAQSVPVHFGETWGMLNTKLAFMAVEALKKALLAIENNTPFTSQTEIERYKQKPNSTDLTIHWENQTTDEIEALVNACNSKFVGARTFYQGSEVHFVEVSPVDSQTPMFGRTPGEIIHAHPQEGLYVCGKYGQLLRINILKTDAGVLTGAKYANMGVQVGHQFTTTATRLTKEVTKIE